MKLVQQKKTIEKNDLQLKGKVELFLMFFTEFTEFIKSLQTTKMA